MTTRKQGRPATTAVSLSGQIDSLQEAFRKLTKAATLKELALQFSGVLHKNAHASTVDLFFRASRSSPWQRLIDGGTKTEQQVLRLPRTRFSRCFIHKHSKSLILVQRLVDKSFIGIVVGRPKTSAAYSDEDAVILRLFGNLFDTAYQELLSLRHEKELVFSLKHRVLQLTSLIDTGIEIAKLDQNASPQQLALERAASLTNASKGVVQVTKGNLPLEEHYFPDGMPAERPTGRNRRIASHFSFAEKTYTFELYEKESRSGVQPFEVTDQLLLDALTRQVHASLENRYLHEQALEKQRIERDIAVAAAIQKRILPTSLPAVAGYDIAGINIPSKWIGGDYYDCRRLPDGRYALVIADVAGKGVQAALLVSSLHAYLSAYLESAMPLAQLAQRLNKVIYNASTDDKFITAFIAILSPESGDIEFVNAGHNPAYLVKNDNSVQEFTAIGLPLGMLDMEFPAESERVTIAKGERLLLYTDGITEAANEEDLFYDSYSPLRDFVLKHRPQTAAMFVANLIDDIKQFTGSAPQNDDITALYLHRSS